MRNSKTWPVIIERAEPPVGADEWAAKKAKLGQLER